MTRASPISRSFNAGVFSELMEGRTDLDRYPASARVLHNFIAAPQGPAIARSGTSLLAPTSRQTDDSVLQPFIFSNEQAQLLEFASDRIRFLDEDGILIYPYVASTVSATTPSFKIDAATLAANVGDDVVLNGYPDNYNLNGEITRITAKVGTVYTLEIAWPTGKATVAASVARVYHVALSYTTLQRQKLRVVQSVDVLYLLCGTKVMRKLSRYGAYDWRITDVAFIDGPYMPENETATLMKPLSTGNAIPEMTSNTLPSGVAASSGDRVQTLGTAVGNQYWLNRVIEYDLFAADAYMGFNSSDNAYWAGDAMQKGWLSYDFGANKTIDGYTIYIAKDNQDPDYIAKDYAPSTWVLEGSANNITFSPIDERDDYVTFSNSKTLFFQLDNPVTYRYYRLNIKKLYRNGQIEARVKRLVLRGVAEKSIAIQANSLVGINRDAGFKSTDVGRLIRIQGSDKFWRSLRITAVTNAQNVVATLEGEPFPDLRSVKAWRLGYWSDTTGWPSCGDFFEDRFALNGGFEYPDTITLSSKGLYETFSQTDPDGAVLDDNAVVVRLNGRRLAGIRWMAADEKGLLIGTGSGEYILSSAQGDLAAVTGRNVKARNSTARGSADVEPVKVDRQVLYVQRSQRTLREMAYVYEADGYKSPSMSQLASHLGTKKFKELQYASEPHSIVWVRREDNSVVGLTYNREENVIGWHTHDFGGEVLSLCVLPQADQAQDALYLIVKRNLPNGPDFIQKRYIEKLTRFWDFDMFLSDAQYVDCALRYNGAETTVLYGLQHLENMPVYGLANEKPFGPITVNNGSITLPFPAERVVVGVGIEAELEIPRLDNGAQDGTAMGKTGRIHNVSALMWSSYGGEVGLWNMEKVDPETDKLGVKEYRPIDYPRDALMIDEVDLYTGEVGPFDLPPGYEKKNTVSMRRPKNSPLPFNVIAIMPQMNKQDR